jgi:iron complex transport system substrate-binding protein
MPSLLPSATEIVAALGCARTLVGVSHECDDPAEITDRPRITRCEIHGKDLPSAEVDAWGRNALADRGTLYTLDEALVQELRPDLILTQQLCDVCAVDYGSVAAFARPLVPPPQVVNLEPATLEDILTDIRCVGELLVAPGAAAALVAALERRIEPVSARAARAQSRPRCLLLEWTDPPYCGGHWSPQLVALAGGSDPLGRPDLPSRRIGWEEILAAQPDLIVLALCGYSAPRAERELALLAGNPARKRLRAVQEGRVFTLDGNAYCSRPGPRIVDGLERLAAILHPA